MADAATAIETTTFAQRPDHHVTRLPMLVDEDGWNELGKIYGDTLQKALEVQAASAERMSGNPEAAGIPVRAIAMFFEMPAAVR